MLLQEGDCGGCGDGDGDHDGNGDEYYNAYLHNKHNNNTTQTERLIKIVLIIVTFFNIYIFLNICFFIRIP